MMNYYLVLVLLSSVYAETEKIKATVKVGKTKFTCTFTLASDGGNVTLNESKVACTPNKPTKKKVQDYVIFTDSANYTLSFNINPEKLTKASMGKFHTNSRLITAKNSSIYSCPKIILNTKVSLHISHDLTLSDIGYNFPWSPWRGVLRTCTLKLNEGAP